MCGYDAIALNQLIQEQQGLPEEESVILTSMCNEIGNLSVKQGDVCSLIECMEHTSESLKGFKMWEGIEGEAVCGVDEKSRSRGKEKCTLLLIPRILNGTEIQDGRSLE